MERERGMGGERGEGTPEHSDGFSGNDGVERSVEIYS